MTKFLTVNPESWLDDYGDMLYRYAVTRVRCEEVAEDLLQETLLVAIQSVAKFKGNSSVSSWLVGILKHKIIDYYRQSKREIPLLNDIDLNENLINHQFDEQGNWQISLNDWELPEQILENQEFWQVFHNCQSRLSDINSRLFILRVVDGISTEECRKLLGFKTDNQLWVTLSRIRMQIRHCLDVNWFNQEQK